MEKRNLALVCGGAGVFFIFISILLIKGDYSAADKKETKKADCQVTFHKVFKNNILTYCYNTDKYRGEFVSIYSKVNGTKIVWKGEKLHAISAWMKRAFENYSRIIYNHTYDMCCDYLYYPNINLKFRQGVLLYSEIEHDLVLSAPAVYTLYYWLCF